MSEVIDRKVVEMQFDNRDFEDNAKKSISTLGLLSTALNFSNPQKAMTSSFAKMKEAIQSIDFRKIAQDVNDCAHSFGNFVRTIVDVYAIGTAVRALQGLEAQVVSLVKSLSTDNISAGWTKYGDKTQSMQTIVAATGKSIDEVNESLEKLMWFSDETSYSFTDMTANIGKFTSAGVGLEDSVNAMMGISNLAAVSGQGIGEAGRAMYNFAQALSVGSVKLMDWKSIENANMATVEFKQTIMDTAVATGDLVKVGDKYFTKTKRTEVTTKNFSQTLNDAWFTSDVLVKSLGKYSSYADQLYNYMNELDDPTMTASEAMEKMGYSVDDLGYKSFRAAQEALTFKQAIDATKDAVSSGWSITFENIFGNYEQAKKLWTDVANELYDIFATDGNDRNDLLANALGLNHHEKLNAAIKDAGLSEEEFNKRAAKALYKHGLQLSDLVGEYDSLEDYVSKSDEWATPELVAEVLDDAAKSYSVIGEGPERAAENWENLKTQIESAGGSVDTFLQKAVEVAGDTHFDEYADLESWAKDSLTSSVISGTFTALAEEGENANKVIQKNKATLGEMNKLIDDILLGKLGAGQERIDAITKKGYDAAKVQELVNKRAKGQTITLGDLNGTLAGITESSESVITNYKNLADTYGTAGDKLRGLADETRTAGSEMYRLTTYLNTKSGREFIAETLVEVLQQLNSVISLVKEAWSDIFPPMTGVRLTEIIEKIRNFIFNLRLSDEAAENFKSTFRGLFSILSLIKTAFSSLLHALSPILGNFIGIRDGVLSITGSLGTALENIMKTIESFFQAFNNRSMGALPEIFSEIGTKAIELARSFSDLFRYNDLGEVSIFEKIDTLIGNIRQKVSELRTNILLLWNSSGNDELSERFANLRDILQGIKGIVMPVIEGVRRGIELVIASLSKALNWIYSVFLGNLKKDFSILDSISWMWSFRANLASLKAFIESIKWSSFLDSLKNIASSIGETFSSVTDTLKDIGGSIKDLFGNIGDAIKQFGEKAKSQTILNYAFAIGVLGAALFVLSQVDPGRLMAAGAALLVLMKALTEVSKSLSDQKVLKKGFFDKTLKQNVKDLIPFAFAVLILAAAVKKLGELDLGQAIQGTITVGIIMDMLAKTLKKMERQKGTYVRGGVTAILMGAAVRILVGAVKQLGELDFWSMLRGVTGVGIVLTELALAYDLLSKNKKRFQTGGITIVLMAASVRILKDVILDFASMDWDSMARAVIGLGAVITELAGAYILLSHNKSRFQTGGVTLVLLASSVKILQDTIKMFSGFDWDTIGRSLAGLGGVLLELVGAYFLLGLNKKTIQTGGVSLYLIAASTKTISSVVTAFAALTLEQMELGIGGLTVALAELVGVYAILGAIKKPSLLAVVGLWAIANTFKILGDVITDIAKVKPERLWHAVGALAAAVVISVGALAVLSSLPAVLGPVMLGVLGLAAIIAEIGILLAAFGAIAQIPGVQWIIGEGGKLLQTIGESIGKFIGGLMGGISGGFMESYTGTLPAVADNLSHFMERLAPFLASVKNVDEGTFQNLKTLNKVMAEVVMLAGADWIFKLGNKGKSAFLEIGEQMVVFGTAINQFVAGVLGVNSGASNAVEMDTDKIGIIKECLDTIHVMLGWQLEFPRKDFEAFCENLRKFAIDTMLLGPAVAAFFSGMLLVNEAGEPTIDAHQIELIKDSVPIITDLANTEFKCTQDKFAEFGSAMNAFARELPGLGTGLNGFIKNTIGLMKEDPSAITITQADVDLVKSAIPIVTDLGAIDFTNATEVNFGSTQSNMTKFAGELPGFGKALNSFIAAVVGIQIHTDAKGNAIDTTTMISSDDVAIAKEAVGLASEIAGIQFTTGPDGLSTLGENLTDFGEGLEGLGEPLGTFINGLGGSGFTGKDGNVTVPAVNGTKIQQTQKAIEAVMPLAAIQLSYTSFTHVKTALAQFGQDLDGFGTNLHTFITNLTTSLLTTNDNGEEVTIPAVDSERIKSVSAAIQAVLPLTEVPMPHITGVKGKLFGGEGDLQSLADGLGALGEPLHSFIVSAGKFGSKDVNGETNFDINQGMITTAVSAIGVIDELAKIQLPEIGGLEGTLLGGKGLDLLTKDDVLSKTGSQLASFLGSFTRFNNLVDSHGNTVKATDPGGVVDTAKAAVGIIDALANINVPTEQNDFFKWFTGDNTLENFTENFGTIGESLHNFIAGVLGLTETVNDDGKLLLSNTIDHTDISQIVEPAVGILEQLAKIEPVISQRLDGSGFGTNLDVMSGELPSIGEKLRNFITTVVGLTGFNEDGEFVNLTDTMPPIDMAVVDYVRQVSDIMSVFAAASVDMVTGKNADFKKFGQKLKDFAPYVQDFVSEVGKIFDPSNENPINRQQIEDVLAVVPLISSLFSTELTSVSSMDENAKTYISKIAADLATFFGVLNENTFENDNINIITSFLTSVSEADGSNFSTFAATFSTDISSIKTSIESLPTNMSSIGVNVIAGLITGLKNLDQLVLLKQAAGDLATITKETIANTLGIESPSTVMRDYIGGNIAAGLVEGLQNGSGSVGDAASDLGGAIISGVEKTTEGLGVDTINDTVNALSDLDKKLYAAFDTAASEKLSPDLADGIGLLGEEARDATDELDDLEEATEKAKKSKIANAMKETVEETNVDEAAGFADKTVAALDSRSGDFKEKSAKLVGDVIANFKAAYGEFETIGSTWGQKVIDALAKLTGTSTIGNTAKNNIIENFMQTFEGINLDSVTYKSFGPITEFVNNLHDILFGIDLDPLASFTTVFESLFASLDGLTFNAEAYQPVIDFVSGIKTIFEGSSTEEDENPLQNLLDAFTSFIDGVNNAEIDEENLTAISTLATEMANAAKGLSGADSNTFGGFVKQIANAVTANKADIQGAAKELNNEMLAVFKANEILFYLVGIEVVIQICNGMRDTIGMAVDQAGIVAQAIIMGFDPLKDQTSKIGSDAIAEMAKGMTSDESKQAISDALDSLFNPQESTEEAEGELQSSLGSTYGQQFVTDMGEGIQAGALELGAKISEAFSSAGESIDMSSFSTTASAALTNALTDLSAPIDSLKGAFNGIVPDGAAMGQNMLEGLIQAFDPESELVQQAIAAVAALGAALKAAFQFSLLISSPSKVFRWMGEMTVEGLIVGINGQRSSAVNSMNLLADSVISAGNDAFSKFDPVVSTSNSITKAVNDLLSKDIGEMNYSPTITPVYDFDKFDVGARYMETSLKKQKDAAARIQAAEYLRQEQERLEAENAGSVTYIQNINSPKPPRRLEIYRATNNLLARTKKVNMVQ